MAQGDDLLDHLGGIFWLPGSSACRCGRKKLVVRWDAREESGVCSFMAPR